VVTTEHDGQEGEAPQPVAGTPAGAAESGAGPARPGPRRRRTAVVAIVAAVVVAGGGGAWWATAAGGGGGGSSAAKDGPAPLRLDGAGRPASGGGNYRVTGTLPAGPAKAPVYTADGTVTSSAVGRLAALLKVPGTVVADHDSWRVGGTGNGPSLVVAKAAPGTWSYSRSGTAVPLRPGSTATVVPSAGSTGSPVSAAAAEAAAAPVFKGLGLTGAQVDASRTLGAVRYVTAQPRVGGLPAYGWTTSVEVGADGQPADASGRLAPLVKGADYPVVSAAEAVKELRSAPVVHPMYCRAAPAPGAAGGTGTGSSGAGGCATGGTGQTLEVRGATFGLASAYVAGRPALVPAWLFRTAAPGSATTTVEPVTAVDPAYVAGGASGSPSPSGAPGTVNPGGPAVPPSPTSPPASVNPGGPDRTAVPGQPSSGQSTHRVQVTSYTVAGRTLTLSYEGGLCSTYKASATAGSGKVTVAVVATPKPKGTVCPMLVRKLTQKVELAQPLGTRTVVDASDGHRVPGR